MTLIWVYGGYEIYFKTTELKGRTAMDKPKKIKLA